MRSARWRILLPTLCQVRAAGRRGRPVGGRHLLHGQRLFALHYQGPRLPGPRRGDAVALGLLHGHGVHQGRRKLLLPALRGPRAALSLSRAALTRQPGGSPVLGCVRAVGVPQVRQLPAGARRRRQQQLRPSILRRAP